MVKCSMSAFASFFSWRKTESAMVCDLIKVVHGFVDMSAIVFEFLPLAFFKKCAAVTQFSCVV